MPDIYLESNYLIIKNKRICNHLLAFEKYTEENNIDILISLHIVLEVSLNSLFRLLTINQIKKSVDKLKVIKNLDNISFIDKTILFIYNSNFDFGDNVDKATKYHEIIGKMEQFSEVRNKLLHGHSVSTLFPHEGPERASEVRALLSEENVKKQIKLFKFILKGMRYYIDCLEGDFISNGKEYLKKEFLNDDFFKEV